MFNFDTLRQALFEGIPSTNIGPIITAIGITNSVISFVLTSIFSRPAMTRRRRLAWFTFALMWGSLVLCLFDVIYPFPILCIPNFAAKLGILLWVCGVLTLLYLVNKISSVALTVGKRMKVKLPPFEHDNIPRFGVPFLDDTLPSKLGFGAKILFPILLSSERTAHGLAIAQHFLVEGLAAGEGA
ncbi:MAG TPA: hypothetical protein VLK33_17245, partial [Terriglobales bacterium]|nr:hypothetical protein [Terriglobales bacterium]